MYDSLVTTICGMYTDQTQYMQDIWNSFWKEAILYVFRSSKKMVSDNLKTKTERNIGKISTSSRKSSLSKTEKFPYTHGILTEIVSLNPILITEMIEAQ